MKLINRLREIKLLRIKIITILLLFLNLAFALFNLSLGIYDKSYWFFFLGLYFIMLFLMRMFCSIALFIKSEKVKSISRLIRILLFILSFILLALVILSYNFDVGKFHHKIVMITIATFTFTKITIAIINFIKVRKTNDDILISIRNISLVDACVSILSMQQSMLVSFEGMEQSNIKIMNIFTGLIVVIVSIVIVIRDFKKCKTYHNYGIHY